MNTSKKYRPAFTLEEIKALIQLTTSYIDNCSSVDSNTMTILKLELKLQALLEKNNISVKNSLPEKPEVLPEYSISLEIESILRIAAENPQELTQEQEAFYLKNTGMAL